MINITPLIISVILVFGLVFILSLSLDKKSSKFDKVVNAVMYGSIGVGLTMIIWILYLTLTSNI